MSEQNNPQIAEELALYLGPVWHTLPEEDRVQLLARYQQKRKTSFIYLWWFLSLHYLYMRQWLLFALFFLSLSGLGIWWLIDLFRLKTILREYNTKLAHKLLAELSSVEAKNDV